MVKNLIILILIFTTGLFLSQSANAQKILSGTETNWVNEAKSELQKALSDPDLSDAERISMVEKSARTLKEYGQEAAFPEGKIPLAEMMDTNFDNCKKSIVELNDWSLNLQRNTLDGKLKLINAMQIEVVGKEIELLIPGETVIDLSQDAIGNVFGWNIVEGFNRGGTDDAHSLVEMFKELAKSNKLAGQINQLIEDQKRSLNLINEDRKKLKYTEAILRQKYKTAESSTRTMSGYEGAMPAGSEESKTTVSASETKTNAGTVAKTVTNKSNVLVGTWRFGFAQTGYFLWTFNNDGSFIFKDNMNGGDERQGKYSVSGNILNLYDSDGCEKVVGKYTFSASDDELHFNNISDQCTSRRLTLNHSWEK